MTYRSPGEMMVVDDLLFQGEIDCVRGGWSALSCKGNPGEIEAAKSNGKYDAAFCTSPGALVVVVSLSSVLLFSTYLVFGGMPTTPQIPAT